MTGTIAGFTSTGIDDNATSTAITIDANEHVGVGTTAPATTLHVYDIYNNYITLEANGATRYAGLVLKNSVQNWEVFTNGASAALELRNNTTNHVALSLNTTDDVTVSTGNLVIGTSGKGIDFSATSDGSGTMTSEVLDDYEEGTFTPTTNGDATGVFGGTIGEYTKVGNLVTVRVVFSVSTSFTSNIIGGLPFTSVGDASVSSVMGSTPVYTESSGVNTFGRLQTGHSKVLFYSTTSNNFHAPSTTNNVYRFMLSYRAV